MRKGTWVEKSMDDIRILQIVDHTLLKQTATWSQIKSVCDAGIVNGVASVCVPPCYVKEAKQYVGKLFQICTVVGFPNGYATTATKVFETMDAVENGVDEIEMVVNLGMVKNGRYEDVLQEVRVIKEACQGRTLKVIIETCLLTDEEKVELCYVVSESGADYIQTSSGFSEEGAVLGDIALMRENVRADMKIKAAGGVVNFDDARAFLAAGADRLGTSRLIL